MANNNKKAMLTPKPRTIDFMPRGDKQKHLVKAIEENDIVFATGCAGGGKTFVAVAMAVKALLNRTIDTIIITRPIVEAGESLGFLPGDVRDKTEPYNQPIIDALRRFLGADLTERLIEEGKIQIVPLAYTRGRTYERAWMLLDEAQNASVAQMKMFLTRMGIDSRITITGDESQVDLPPEMTSGLMDALKILKGLDGIGHVHFTEGDVQRHYLVGKIVTAYQKALKKSKRGDGRVAGQEGTVEAQVGHLPKKSVLDDLPARFNNMNDESEANDDSMGDGWIA